MIKTYCDKCGEEIQHLQEIVNISIDSHVYYAKHNTINHNLGCVPCGGDFQQKILHKDCYEKILKAIK